MKDKEIIKLLIVLVATTSTRLIVVVVVHSDKVIWKEKEIKNGRGAPWID